MEDKVVIELDMKAIIVRQFERSELLPTILGCNSLRSNSPSIEANRIMIDDDKTAAMRFIKDYVEPALHRMNYGHCHQMYFPKEGDEK